MAGSLCLPKLVRFDYGCWLRGNLPTTFYKSSEKSRLTVCLVHPPAAVKPAVLNGVLHRVNVRGSKLPIPFFVHFAVTYGAGEGRR